MSELIILERVAATLWLTHAVVNVLRAVETMKAAVIMGERYQADDDFTHIAALALSACVAVRWIAG